MSSPEFMLTPRARADLEALWDVIDEQQGFEQAEAYLQQMFADIGSLVARPRSGTACPEVHADCFQFPSGEHLLLYRLSSDGVPDIVRILDGRLDYRWL